MGYEILAIAWLIFMFFGCVNLYCAFAVAPKKQIEPDYELAREYIRKNNGHYNLDYLLDYLAIHLIKYPDGELPEMAGTITFTSPGNATYTMNFYNAGDARIQKYIKPAIKLLREKKQKANVLKQANRIIRSRRKILPLA